MKTNAIILAAGKGTRMRSLNKEVSKVAFPLLGQPLVSYVLDATENIVDGKKVVVVGFGGNKTQEIVSGRAEVVWQHEQKGTGHAVMQARKLLSTDKNNTLILSGDVPLLSEETLKEMIDAHTKNNAKLTVMSAKPALNYGYGRIVRDENGNLLKIVEQADATEEEKEIREVNAGTYLINNELLFKHLDELNSENKQNEIYLTDMISLFIEKGYKVGVYTLKDSNEMLGINNRVQLAEAEKLMRKRINEGHMLSGVSIENPDNTYIGPKVKIGQDTYVGAGVHLLGNTVIGNKNTIIGDTYIEDSEIGEGNKITSSNIVGAKIGNNNNIGPMARMRGTNIIGNNTRIGNFVEFKSVIFGNGSKCAHLSYLGDAIVGENTNIGCGTITANYDGVNKSKTIIGDNVFVGSGVTIIAPVTIESNSFLAAGSTINRDVKENDLAIARERQTNKEGYGKIILERAKAKKK
ncbi:MAG: bifunctional UDP-N-acetylglucosamine diphosphorylase/glucosamine-1-phosphate N-acetyltransferase GlmU [Bacilli bacterium]|jgi:bifunctional UDP-N-acetylglucosamine pyrophosphorylase/glucosamine-1-phosphate N-acetyltransferase